MKFGDRITWGDKKALFLQDKGISNSLGKVAKILYLNEKTLRGFSVITVPYDTFKEGWE